MLKENFEIIKYGFTEYVGTGMYMALFFVAILYIFLKEKDKNIKALLGGFSVLIFLIVLNPVFSKILESAFTKSVYWRMFWMLPIGVCLAYCGVKIVNDRNKTLEKVLTTISLILIVIVSGKFIFTEQNYSKVGNAYKIPDEIVNVAYILKEDKCDRDKLAMIPASLVAYIRQVDGTISLMYARNPQTYENNKLLKELEAGNVDYVATECKKVRCNYIIFNNATILNGNMEKHGYNLLEKTANYSIYKCEVF